MEIIVKENRQLIIKDSESTQNENDVQNIKLIVPPQYEDFDKKIAFVTEEGVKWGLVENNMYKLERSITKFENVLIYVWLTKDDQDFRSVEEALTFNKNHKVDGEITPEEQTDMEKVISILESEIIKTENLESQVDGKLEEIDTAIDNVNSAIQETENLDLDAEKVNKTTTVTITKKDGTEKNVSIQDGQDGQDGENGVSPTIRTIETTDGYDIEITDINGTKTISVLNGKDGQNGLDGADGRDGEDGFSPIITETQTSTGYNISITDKIGTNTISLVNGKDGQNGLDGQDGVDGVGLDYDWNNTSLGIKREDESEYQYVNLKGDTGISIENIQIINGELLVTYDR